MSKNILLEHQWNTPHECVPFNQISLDDFKEAFPLLIEAAQKEIDKIIADPNPPTFENVIVGQDENDERLGKCSSIFFNLLNAHSSPEMQEYAQEVSAQLSAFSSKMMTNKGLFDKIEEVYKTIDRTQYDEESLRLLDKTYRNFKRGGIDLPKDKQDVLAQYNQELAQGGVQFGQNVLNATNAFEMYIQEDELDGLPKDFVQSAKAAAEAKGQAGYLITLQYPSYLPFMTYSKRRDLREKLYHASAEKACAEPYNNLDLIPKLVNLKMDKAQLLGYDSMAQLILEERMAKKPETVHQFLKDLLKDSIEAGKKDIQTLKDFALKKDGIQELKGWDVLFYQELLKKETLAIDDEMLKPYFELNKTMEGAFKCAEKLFGLQFKLNENIPTYHDEVSAYEVLDKEGQFKALFYADFHPRDSKKPGAWMTSFKSQRVFKGVNERPHVSIVCNFTKANRDAPALLTFNEVTTLFHEFGHALHGMLAEGKYASMSGTSVLWDFVELPSQIMENWCYEKEALDLFAHHYETGASIPSEYIEKIKASKKFMAGYQSCRQISFGLLDMAWHDRNESFSGDIIDFETKAMVEASLLERSPNACMSASFSHIFQGGYAAGYYSYKWAEVLEADAFALFEEKGIFNQEVAQAFEKYILSAGNSQDPNELFKKFRGRKADPKALSDKYFN